VVQHRINKEMYTVSVVFPLFCPTPVYFRAQEQNLDGLQMPRITKMFIHYKRMISEARKNEDV
jgi:hypothetical protein